MRGIIFDLDDTLYRRIDYLRSGFDAVSRYLAHSWRCDADTAFAALMGAHAACGGREFQTVCAELRLPASLVPALVTIFRAHEPALTLRVSVRRMLEKLRADGWRLGDRRG